MSGTDVPLSHVVLKVHSRCDLACEHCYAYEATDQIWPGRPKVVVDDGVAHGAGISPSTHRARRPAAHALRPVDKMIDHRKCVLPTRSCLPEYSLMPAARAVATNHSSHVRLKILRLDWLADEIRR